MAYRIFKRFFDIFFSLLGLIATFLIWIVAIIGIEISDPGPVFYVAKRVGKDNQVFKMYKFRSMRVAREANEKKFKADEDRIFAFGRFIRVTKIDELPQLLNILLGTMSIVGPRPASVDQVDVVRAGEYDVASKVTAGLTGPSALYDYIYGDTISDEAEYEKLVLPTRLKLDVYYVNNMSLLYDVKMIWYTVVCVCAEILGKKPNKIYCELISCVGNSEYEDKGLK